MTYGFGWVVLLTKYSKCVVSGEDVDYMTRQHCLNCRLKKEDQQDP